MNCGGFALLEARCTLARHRRKSLPNCDYLSALRVYRRVAKAREELMLKAWVETKVLT